MPLAVEITSCAEPSGGGRVRAFDALMRAMERERPLTARHCERVAAMARALALACRWSPRRAGRLFQAGLLHDVGKIEVPARILAKPGTLSPREWAAVRRHPERGAALTAGALDAEQRSWVRHHHERWDGAGYPDGLAGAGIPDGARLLALADAWDAMTGERAYRRRFAAAEALVECWRLAGIQFEPAAVRGLVRLRLHASRAPDSRGVLIAAAPAVAAG